MGRIRLQWSRVWSVLGEHFTKMGCSNDDSVGMFPIQISIKVDVRYYNNFEDAKFIFPKSYIHYYS